MEQARIFFVRHWSWMAALAAIAVLVGMALYVPIQANCTEWYCFLGSEVFRGTMMLMALLVAIASVVTARFVARKKQTIELVMNATENKRLNEGWAVIREYCSSKDKKLETLAEEGGENWAKVVYTINYFEKVAIGVNHGIYDDAMLRESWYSLFNSLYDAVSTTIAKQRISNPTHYQEMVEMACRWKKKKLSIRKSSQPTT